MPSEQCRVLFRTAGAASTGFGHIRRCLTLASALEKEGYQSTFRIHGDERVRVAIEEEGFAADVCDSAEEGDETALAARAIGAASVVVDSYDFDKRFFEAIARMGLMTLAIDDLFQQQLQVDLLVNSTLGANPSDYCAGTSRRVLAGSQFALLRSEFAEEPRRIHHRDVSRILVTVGGSDPFDLTSLMVDAALSARASRVDVVVGPLSRSPSVPSDCAAKVAVHRSPADVRALMLAADVALCAGGQTLYELAATATPSVAVRAAENQTANLTAFAACGSIEWVGAAADSSLHERVLAALVRLHDPDRRRTMGDAGRAVVDGRGAARVAAAFKDVMGNRAC